MKSRKDNLKKRLGSSIIAIALTTTLLSFSHCENLRFLIAFIASLAIAIPLWEYFQIAIQKGYHPISKIAIACSILYTYFSFLETQFAYLQHSSYFILLLSLFIFFISHFFYREQILANIAIAFLGFIYVTVALTCVLKILYLHSVSHPNLGKWWCIYLLVVTKSTDIGAYLIGSLIGKRKIATRLSPNKTLEGSIGGLFFSIFSSLLMYFSNAYINISLIQALLLGIFLSIVAQLGDLSESLLKRDANIKDSNSLPGLGGVLDTLDSLAFTAPFLYFLLEAQII